MLHVTAAFASLLATTAPGAIVDPRPETQVVDLTGTLSGDQIATIDGHAARGRAGGELMVVVVRSTDGMNPRQWTTTVFNRLGLDQKARDRGVVLMAAIADRKAEIVVGDGFPGEVTHTTDAIMAGEVVARFKAGDPHGALVQGARAIVDRVLLAGAPAGHVDTTTVLPAERPTLGDERPTERPPPEVIEASQAPEVVSVPDPRRSHGVVDGARLLSKVELAELGAALSAAPGVELAVVTASDTGGLSAATFARGLFLRLQQESPAERAALLVVVAPHATKKAPRPLSTVEVVMSATIPRVVAEGKLAQVSAQWSAAVDQDPSARGRATVQAARSLAEVADELAQWQAMQARLDELARPIVMATAAAPSGQAPPPSVPTMAPSHAHEPSPGETPPLLGLGAFAVSLCGLLLGVREAARRWPRTCKKCQVPMERLGEEVDDQHLSEGEKVEERVGSVDYDVWSCPGCGDVRKLRWGAIISSYGTCSSCSFRTLASKTRTLQAATQYSTGLAEVTEDCAHCGFHRVSTRTIPRRPRPSSSSSSSSSGRSSRGSSSGRGSSGSW